MAPTSLVLVIVHQCVDGEMFNLDAFKTEAFLISIPPMILIHSFILETQRRECGISIETVMMY